MNWPGADIDLYKEFIQTMLERDFNNFRSEMEYVIRKYIAGEIELYEIQTHYQNLNYIDRPKIDVEGMKQEMKEKIKKQKKLLRSEKLKVKSANEEINYLKGIIEKLKSESVHFSMDDI